MPRRPHDDDRFGRCDDASDSSGSSSTSDSSDSSDSSISDSSGSDSSISDSSGSDTSGRAGSTLPSPPVAQAGALPFHLYRFRGGRVQVLFESAGQSREVTGYIYNVGNGFVDIWSDAPVTAEAPGPEHVWPFPGVAVTIPIERITLIEWLEPNCSPVTGPPLDCPPFRRGRWPFSTG